MSSPKKLYARRTVVRKLGIDGTVLDRLEELQIIVPIRRPGRERQYYADDMDRLRVYTVLTRDLNVNQQGAEIILRMRSRMLDLHQRLVGLLVKARSEGMLETIQDLLEDLDDSPPRP